MRIKKSVNISTLILYFIYYILFQILYQTWIVSIYEYQGFGDNFDPLRFMMGALILFGTLLLLKRDQKPSTIYLHIATAIILIPSLVLYAGQDNSVNFIPITIFAFLVIIFVVNVLKVKSIRVLHFNNNTILLGLTLISGLNLLGIMSFGGVQFVNFDLSRVYDIRREAAAAIPGIFGYLNSITTKVFIPFGMVLAIIYKRKILFFLLALFSASFFVLTAHKSPLFYPLVVVFFYYAGKTNKIITYTLLGLVGIIVLSGLGFLLQDVTGDKNFEWFGALFSNRTLLVPAALNSIYIDFFSDQERYYWAFSKISLGLVQAPYDLNIANLIGSQYFGSSNISANAGWIGSGYANAGYAGVAIYSITIGLLFLFFDAYSNLVGTKFLVALFILPVVMLLTSADMTDMLLTHGLVFAVLILILLDPREIYAIEAKNIKPRN